MPKFTHLFTEQVFIARRAQIPGTDKFLASTVTSAYAHIQQLSDEATSLTEGVYGKTFVFWCDGAVDVQEGDKLRCGSDYYTVKASGVTRRDFGSFDYKKIIVEKQ